MPGDQIYDHEYILEMLPCMSGAYTQRLELAELMLCGTIDGIYMVAIFIHIGKKGSFCNYARGSHLHTTN